MTFTLTPHSRSTLNRSGGNGVVPRAMGSGAATHLRLRIESAAPHPFTELLKALEANESVFVQVSQRPPSSSSLAPQGAGLAVSLRGSPEAISQALAQLQKYPVHLRSLGGSDGDSWYC